MPKGYITVIESELKKFIIKQSQTIYDAMNAINENWHEVVFVENDSSIIIGTVTDGDIRRGLLNGLEFRTPIVEVMNSEFISVSENMDRATVLDLMKAHSIRQIPILNITKQLVGIHFMQDLLGAVVKPNIAIIMAGGKGKRLLPLTENCPKPMIKVAGRPILERVILHLIGYGIKSIYLSINYLGDMIERYFGDGSQFGCSIKYLHEERPLGTGGALSLIDEMIENPFIVMNGDLVTQVNFARLLEFHSSEGSEATIAVRPYEINIPYGVIINDDSQLVEIQEKPSMHFLINSGIYVLNPSTLKLIPRNEEYPITLLFNKLLKMGEKVGVYVSDEEWIDVGRHDELRRANGLS